MELSRQAAETAALIGQHKHSLLKEFAHAGAEFSGELPGIGGIASGLFGLAMNPTAWVAGAVGGGLLYGIDKTYEAAQERDHRIREAKEASRQCLSCRSKTLLSVDDLIAHSEEVEVGKST